MPTFAGIITDLSAPCVHDVISFTNLCILANKLSVFFSGFSISILRREIVSVRRFSSSETMLAIFSPVLTTDSTTDSTNMVVSSTIILLVSSTNLGVSSMIGLAVSSISLVVSSTTLTASSMIGLAVSSTTFAASSTTTSLFPTRLVAISSINLDVSSMTDWLSSKTALVAFSGASKVFEIADS